MKKTIIALTAIAVAGISGCASTGPVPLGGGKYMISDTNSMYYKGGEVLKDILVEANTFCAKQGKTVEVINTKTTNYGYGTSAGADVIFVCK